MSSKLYQTFARKKYHFSKVYKLLVIMCKYCHLPYVCVCVCVCVLYIYKVTIVKVHTVHMYWKCSVAW